jgi:membrane-bound lytic murein transglycosylase B
MKLIKTLSIILIFISSSAKSDFDTGFEKWKVDFKKIALLNNISEKTFNKTIKGTVFLPKVIQYDRFQPEFYENTKKYVSQRTSSLKVKKGLKFYQKNKTLINKIEINFDIEKELMLALMGIETNFGTYVGKMDILSSLATLSYDKRRSKFFSNELITLLKLIDNETVDYKTLYGSWAGAFGFFQFMPSTMKNYALDYDGDNVINLKSATDSYASAANYLNKIGWKKNQPCFYKIELKDNIPSKFLNSSAKKIHNKKKLKFFKRFIVDSNKLDLIDQNLETAIITPDKDIIPDSINLKPAFIIFENYEKILQWNRSLRFSLAVCTLKEKFENEL